jgi:hypothetical protein
MSGYVRICQFDCLFQVRSSCFWLFLVRTEKDRLVQVR